MSILAPRSLSERAEPISGPERGALAKSPGIAPGVLHSILLLTLGAWIALFVQALRIGGDDAFLSALCSASGAAPGSGLAGFLTDWAGSAGVWALMSMAMMLPTLLPLAVSTAQRAHARGVDGASPAWLVAGYLLVWLGIAVAAGLLQVLLLRAGSWIVLPSTLAGVLSGAAIGAAGLYQLSDLKDRFLSACRHQASAESAAGGIASLFRAGLAHGRRCVACCVGIMALMLVAGAMNLFWMAILTVLMTVERLTEGRWASRAIGAGLVTAGAAVAVSAVGVTPILRWAVG